MIFQRRRRPTTCATSAIATFDLKYLLKAVLSEKHFMQISYNLQTV